MPIATSRGKRGQASHRCVGLRRRTVQHPAEQILGNYVARLEVEQGAIHIRFGNRASRALADKWLTLRPGTSPNASRVPISWLCGVAHPVSGLDYSGVNRTDIEARQLPLDCRL